MGDDKPQTDPQKNNKRTAIGAQAAAELAAAGQHPSNITTGALPPAGFHYDSSTGYYYRPTSHGTTTSTNNPIVYYDTATNMYYHKILQEWGYINHSIEGYIEGSGREFVSSSGQHREWLAEEEEEEDSKEEVMEEIEREEENEMKQQQGKRGAVIGSGPKLNAEGLLEAARQEDLKIQERREKRKRVVGIIHKCSGWAAKRKGRKSLDIKE